MRKKGGAREITPAHFPKWRPEGSALPSSGSLHDGANSTGVEGVGKFSAQSAKSPGEGRAGREGGKGAGGRARKRKKQKKENKQTKHTKVGAENGGVKLRKKRVY